MNLLDFENEFIMDIEFTGDYETDEHSLSIKREAFDAYGHYVQITERYTVTTHMIEEIARGLEAALRKIEKHLKQ